MTKFITAIILALFASTAHADTLYTPSFLEIGAPWSGVTTLTRYPATGTYDVSSMQYVGGVMGLDPASGYGFGTMTFFWTSDAAGAHIIGPQGISLASGIPSLAQLRIMNQGPYLYMTYQPFAGVNYLHANLFLTNVSSPLPELPADTILVTEAHTLASNLSVGIWSADYFAGEAVLFLDAPQGVYLTVYGVDLTGQYWATDTVKPGPGKMTVLPMGAWLVVVSNPTNDAIAYRATVTPLLTPSLRRVQ